MHRHKNPTRLGHIDSKGRVFQEGTVLMINNLSRNLYNRVIVDGIRFFTKCKYHHAGIVGLKDNELWVFEAVFRGFVPTKPLEEWLEGEGVRFDLAIFNPFKLEEGGDVNARTITYQQSLFAIRERLYSITGSPYDFGSLLMWQIVYQLTGRWCGKRGQSALNRIYCTEAIAFILGFEKWWTYDPTKLYNKLLEMEIENSQSTNNLHNFDIT